MLNSPTLSTLFYLIKLNSNFKIYYVCVGEGLSASLINFYSIKILFKALFDLNFFLMLNCLS